MNLYQAIEARRTIRDFSCEAVPEDVIHRALDAGLKAPSHNHQKEWHFVLLKDQESKQAVVRTEELSDKMTEQSLKGIEQYEPLAQKMYLEAIPKQGKMVLSAPVVLVMVFKPSSHLYLSQNIANMNCLAAAWCCIENILLSLAADNIFCTTMVPRNTPAVKEALGIPQHWEVAAIIPFGYKAEDATILLQKKVELDERIHTDKW